MELTMSEPDKKSITELESILEKQKKVFGLDHPVTLVSSYKLIIAINEVGDTEKALSLIEDLIPNFERVFGAVNEQTLNIKNSYAYLLEENDDSEQAIEVMQELFNQYRENFELEQTLDILIELAIAIEEASDGIEAGPYYYLLIDDLEKFHGQGHVSTINMRKRFAYAYYWDEYVPAQISALRELEIALHDLYQIFAEVDSEIDETHIKTLEKEVTDLYDRLNSYYADEVIEERWRENLNTLMERYGVSHPSVFRHKHSLALCEFQQGKSEEALSSLNSLLKEQTEIYGMSDRGTLATQEAILEVLEDLNMKKIAGNESSQSH
jgi:tetratricopeptide (TPR) repeat protein